MNNKNKKILIWSGVGVGLLLLLLIFELVIVIPGGHVDTGKMTQQYQTNLDQPSSAAQGTPTENRTLRVSPAVVGLLDVLPYVFVAIILLSAVAWIGARG